MTVESIVEALSQDFLRFAVHITGDFHRANDIYHDVLVKAIEQEDIFKDLSLVQIKAWFFKAIKNKHIDLCRRQKHEAALYKEGQASVFEDRHILKMAMTHLTDQERRVVSLKYFAGYKSHEIADIVGLKASTVRNRLSTARAKLRKIYQEDE